MRKKQIDTRETGTEFRNIRDAYFELLQSWVSLVPVLNEVELRQKPFNETKVVKQKLKELKADLADFEKEFSEVMVTELRKK